MTVFYCCTIF